ncbi:MAG: ATP-binding cassette domain-containing protein [Candidatus Goldiibacteriota bacterium]|jgi:ABC-2 type transport system ATP-binding protein
MNTIEAVSLTKKYEKLTAVDALNLSVKKGEIFGLLGPNGAGKTTTLMMLSTLLKPTSGSASINGFDVLKEPSKVRASIGMVFQDPSSDEILTAYENLKLHALLYNIPVKEIDIKIDRVLALVDLQKRKNDIVKTFSGGMRRRMEIARGLLHEPKIFFLDEPTIGLDPQTREHIWEYIKNLARETEMTIILTTHYMEEADRLCDRVAIIDAGKIVALDSPENLKRGLGGDIVLLKGANLAVEEIRKLPFVKAVEEQGAYLQLSIEESGKHLQELLKVAGVIEFVQAHSPDLNDVFLHYTGREIREEEGSSMDRLRAISRAKNK